MKLLKRPALWLVALIALLLAVLVYFLGFMKTNSVEPAAQTKPVPGSKPSPAPISGPGSAAAAAAASQTPPRPKVNANIDPEVLKLANELNSPDTGIQRDLEVVNEFVTLYRKAFQSNPTGLNEDITAALTGTNPANGMLFPASNKAIRDGKLVDRWGTPFFFHPESGYKMEIRSAGPDKELFTTDDVLFGQ